jgi:hypothetical protein
VAEPGQAGDDASVVVKHLGQGADPVEVYLFGVMICGAYCWVIVFYREFLVLRAAWPILIGLAIRSSLASPALIHSVVAQPRPEVAQPPGGPTTPVYGGVAGGSQIGKAPPAAWGELSQATTHYGVRQNGVLVMRARTMM